MSKAKKLLLVLAMIILITVTTKQTYLLLEYILYIYYLMHFKKTWVEIQTLINFKSEINVRSLVYMLKIGFKIRFTDIEALKIDYSILKTF